MNKHLLSLKIACMGIYVLLVPILAPAAPTFPQNQAEFEHLLSLPQVPSETKGFRPNKGYECVTADAPRAAILFDFDSATLKLDFHPILEELAQALHNRLSDADFIVEGHTDSSGSATYNLGLSLRRAETVSRYLHHKGIAPARLRVEGKGEDVPIADNATPQGQALNRRVEIVRVSGVCAP
jgi:outer membrane protein OmpA-like peptidoglycan-associated protein